MGGKEKVKEEVTRVWGSTDSSVSSGWYSAAHKEI